MKNTILYLDCASGISGDMTVAALLDLGADRTVLMDALASLPLDGYTIEIKDVYKSGIRACDFNVLLAPRHENHDHDMEYLHGVSHIDAHQHFHHRNSDADHHNSCEDAKNCAAENHDDCGDTDSHLPHMKSHPHPHHDARNLQDITQIICAGNLTPAAASLALDIFQILAEAEASVHGKKISEVHFHEVGAVDSIIDIVAAAVCLDNLHPEKIIVSPLTEGRGMIRCQHGLIPIPVPAVTEIAAQKGLILKISGIEGELITPTGAAIAAAAATSQKLPPEFRILRVGCGAGKRDYKTCGILRAMLIESAAQTLSAPMRSELNAQNSPAAMNLNSDMQACPAAMNLNSDMQTCPAAMNLNSDTQACHTAMNLSSDTQACHAAMNLNSDTQACHAAILPDAARAGTRGGSHAKINFSGISSASDTSDTILMLETNIDDCTGEALSYTLKLLLEAGALDAFFLPIYMKKNRPAYLLKVICAPEARRTMESIIFKNTTTIGIRIQEVFRTKLERKIIAVETPWGMADVKCCTYGDEMYYYPENDSVCSLAAEQNIGFPEMYNKIQCYCTQSVQTQK